MKGAMMDKLLKDLIQFFENYQAEESGPEMMKEGMGKPEGASIEVMKIGKPKIEVETEDDEKEGMC